MWEKKGTLEIQVVDAAIQHKSVKSLHMMPKWTRTLAEAAHGMCEFDMRNEKVLFYRSIGNLKGCSPRLARELGRAFGSLIIELT